MCSSTLLDDYGLAPLADLERRDLLEVLENRQGRKSNIVVFICYSFGLRATDGINQ